MRAFAINGKQALLSFVADPWEPDTTEDDAIEAGSAMPATRPARSRQGTR